jgi:hypothetical protein
MDRAAGSCGNNYSAGGAEAKYDPANVFRLNQNFPPKT